MTNTDDEFWAVINNSRRVKSSDLSETIRYCRGTLDHAIDLIEENKLDAANRKLMSLTDYIDRVQFSEELDEILHEAWALVRELDLPIDDCNDYLIEFRLPPHLTRDDRD
jgi:hypothetical protein